MVNYRKLNEGENSNWLHCQNTCYLKEEELL